MGRGVEPVDEPGLAAHGCGDAEGEILGELEGLEVVEDDRFLDAPLEMPEGAGLEEQSVPPEPGAQAGDGRGRAAERAGDLAVGGAGLQAGGDGHHELGAL